MYGNRDLEMYQNGRKHVAQMMKSLEKIEPHERAEILQGHAAVLRSRSRVHEGVPGAKEVNRIVASAGALPEDLADFYSQRLACEVLKSL